MSAAIGDYFNADPKNQPQRETGVLDNGGQFAAIGSVSILFNLRDVQLDLKVLWDGHLARPNLGGQDAHPTIN